MKKLTALILALCLLLPCVAEVKTLTDFVQEYNLYASIVGAGEISEASASLNDSKSHYQFECTNGATLLVRTDLRGGMCVAPKDSEGAFLRSSAAAYFALHGTGNIIDFLGFLLYDLLLAGDESVSSDPDNLGDALIGVIEYPERYAFIFQLIG
ncbi:MAG: hypothetical protein IKY06_08960 [Clostridia bacterium]|nr:hypothetical protein [Clostridia bacterium]